MRFAFVFAFVVSCSPAARPPESDSVCSKYRSLNCPGGDPTPAGTPCEQVIEDMAAAGVPLPDPACYRIATTCSQIDQCAN